MKKMIVSIFLVSFCCVNAFADCLELTPINNGEFDSAEYLFIDKNEYEKAKKGSLSRKYICKPSSCAQNEPVTLAKGHVFMGQEVNADKIYKCVWVGLLTGKWEPIVQQSEPETQQNNIKNNNLNWLNFTQKGIEKSSSQAEKLETSSTSYSSSCMRNMRITLDPTSDIWVFPDAPRNFSGKKDVYPCYHMDDSCPVGTVITVEPGHLFKNNIINQSRKYKCTERANKTRYWEPVGITSSASNAQENINTLKVTEPSSTTENGYGWLDATKMALDDKSSTDKETTSTTADSSEIEKQNDSKGSNVDAEEASKNVNKKNAEDAEQVLTADIDLCEGGLFLPNDENAGKFYFYSLNGIKYEYVQESQMTENFVDSGCYRYECNHGYKYNENTKRCELISLEKEVTKVEVGKEQLRIQKQQKASVNIEELSKKLSSLTLGLDKSKWKTADGKFNSARLGVDLGVGAAVGAVGGVVTNVLMKKGQTKNGFEDISCTVGGEKVADWGDEFILGM